MKKILIIPAIIIMMVSCEWIKEATEIDFQSDFKKGFPVELDEGDTDINIVDTIDLTDDNEFKKYKDVLEDVELDSIGIKITSYVGPDKVLLNGTLGYAKIGAKAGTTLAEIKDLNVTELYNSGAIYNVAYKESEVNNITEIMLKEKTMEVYLIGTASQAPATFNVQVIFYTTVIAQPLK